MDEYVFNIWSHDRKIKNLFVCGASIDNVIKKAHSLDMQGEKLVLERDGSVIREDAVLEHYCKHKIDNYVFMLMSIDDEWLPAHTETKMIESHINDVVQLPVPVNETMSTSQNTEYIFVAEDENIESTSYSSEAVSLDTTLSMSSTAMSSSSETNMLQCTRIFSQFKIPWQKMPHDVWEMLQNKKMLNKRLTALANVIVDELRALSFYIPMSVFRSVAQQAAEQFPDSIIERDEKGNFISSQPLALITKMKNRNNTMNRAPKRKIPEVDLNIPLKERRISNVLQKTCANWQPNQHSNTSNSTGSIEFKKKFLQDMYNKEKITNVELKTIEGYMKDTFADQRLFLNNRENIPDINTIISNWPYLFDKQFLKDHFKLLMNVDSDQMKINFESKKDKINIFLLNCKNKDLIKDAEKTDINIFKNLLLYFKEDVNYIFKSFAINGQQQVLSSTMPAMPNEKTTPISLDDNNFDDIKMKEHQLVGTSSSSSTSTSSSSSNTSVKLIKCNNGSQSNRNSKNISYCCNYENCCNDIDNLSLNGLSTTITQQQQQQQTDSSIIQQTASTNGINLCNNISNNSNNYCNNSSNNQYIISTTSTSSSTTTITTPITYKSRHSLNNIIKASSDCCSSTKLANNLLNYNNSTTVTSTTTPIPSSSSTTISTIESTITAAYNRINNSCTGYTYRIDANNKLQQQNYANDTARKINGMTAKSTTPTTQQQQQQNRQQQNCRSNVPIKKSVNDFIFGKYIGEGSFSTVYLASDIHTKKEYAIKVCEKHHIIREKKQEYIKREREVMHLVSNVPGFVNLYCTFQDDSRLYFAMTHAKHGDLLPYINKVGSFDLECTQHYAAELVLACENMHKRGIIHRDLKPENILLDENMHTLIADFGSAKILDNNSQNVINMMNGSIINNSVAGSSPPSSTTTKTTTSRTTNNHQHQKSDSSDGGCASTDSDADINNESNRRRRKCSFVGTAQYVTPEILQNGPITRSVDLWALGCIIYQMISGLPPFRGTNDYFIFKEILGLNLIFPDGFDKNAEDLVRKLLKINPIERLGAQDKTDIYESIREHKFFDGINWDTIRTKTPPPIYPYLPGVNKDEELRSQYRVPDNLEPGLDNIKLTRLLGLSLLGYEAGNNKTEPEGDIDLTDEIDKQQNIEAQKIDNWDAFADGEVILKKGFINKRKGLFARKRMLLLTSRPRLIYIDPVQMVKKGEIPWSSELRVEPKNFKIFFVHTPNRTYYLEDPEGYALNWVDAIENIRKSTYNNQSS